MKHNQKGLGACTRIMTLLLTMLMLMGLSLSASADGTAWIDDFDQYTADIDLETGTYPNASCTSDVFKSASGSGANTLVDADGGRNGTAALALTSNTTSGNSLTWNTFSSLDEGQTMVIAYDMKFSDVSNLSDTIWLDGGTIHSRRMARVSSQVVDDVTQWQFQEFNNASGTVQTRVPIAEDKWYTFVLSISKVSGVEVRDINIYDDEGTKLISRRNTMENWRDDQLPYSLSIPVTASGTTTITIDNAKLMRYTAGLAPAIASSDVENEAVDVVRNPSFTFVFDRPVAGTPTLKKNGTEAVATTVSVDVNVVTMTLSDGALLEKGTAYNIDFSGVTSTEAVPVASTETIAFTTEYASLLEVASVTAVADSTTVTASYTLSDPNGYPDFTGYAAAALYDSDGLLKGIDVLSAETVNTGEELSRHFTLTAASGDTLQLMLFDVTRGVVPVASGECTVAVTP